MTTSERAAGEQLAGLIDRYPPEVATVAREALAILRARFRGATELVYDNYNALAIGWTPTARTSDVICSIALYPRWVTLFFLHGKGLPDPDGRLAGAGARVRHVVLADGAATLRQRAVRALLAAAIARAPVALDRTRPSSIVIKSISAKQRPRRPVGAAAGARPATISRRGRGRPALARDRR